MIIRGLKIIVVFVLLICGAVFTGAWSASAETIDGINDTSLPACCDHPSYQWRVVRQPNCVQTGLQTGMCKNCGNTVQETIPVNENGHLWGGMMGIWFIEKYPTTEEDGLMYSICSYCNQKKTQTIPKISSVISKEDFSISGPADMDYSGQPLQPEVRIASKGFSGFVLNEGEDYTLSYSDNINAGYAKVTITGIGNFTGKVTQYFRIKSVKLGGAELVKTSYRYTGKKIKPEVNVYSDYGDLLTRGKDYVVTYDNNVRIGTGEITIKGIGNYRGTLAQAFTITKKLQPMKVAVANKKLSLAKVRMKAREIQAITVMDARGGVTYQKTYGKRCFKVNSKTGKITVKRGTKKGTYRVKVKVTAAGNNLYSRGSKTVIVMIRVE